MKALVGLFFETGDSTCPYWEVWVTVEDGFHPDFVSQVICEEEFCDLDLEDDEEYEDIAEQIMNQVAANENIKWDWFKNPCDGIINIFTFYV